MSNATGAARRWSQARALLALLALSCSALTVRTASAEGTAGAAEQGAQQVAAQQADARRQLSDAVAAQDVTFAAPQPLLVAERSADGGVDISRTMVGSRWAGDVVVAAAALGGDLVAVSFDTPVTLELPPQPTAAPAAAAASAAADGGSPNATSSNDPYRSQQWSLDVTSFEAAAAGVDGADGDGVVVAVVDTGVESGHVDLAGKVLPGQHYLHNGSTAVSGSGAEDDHHHGTHVAGIIAALTGNGLGVASAAPGAMVLPVKVLGSDGSGWLGDVALGIVWAADNGADIINLSLGASMSTPDPVLHAAVDYAHANGVVLFAAAGNTGCTVGVGGCTPFWPAAEANVVAVGSLGDWDVNQGTVDPAACSTFTTRAGYVDLGAPGYSVLSTYLSSSLPGSPPYAYSSGTSMASPYASAAAAVLLSAEPALSPAQVVAALQSSADDVVTAGVDSCSGAGMIDPAGAIAGLSLPPAATTTTSSASTTSTSASTTTTSTSPPGGEPAPRAVPRLAGVVSGRAMVRVSFQAPAGATAVNVYRDGALLATVPGGSRSYTDRSGGTAVRNYAVAAVYGADESAASPARGGRAR